MKRLLLLFSFTLVATVTFAQTALEGKVVDIDNDNDPLPFATVQLLKDDVFIQGVNTDFDGNYFFANIDPGTYTLRVGYTGYPDKVLTGVPVLAGKNNSVDVEMTSDGGVIMDLGAVVTAYKVPLVEPDNTTSGQTLTSEQIRNLPTRNINQLASLAAGASSADEGGAINIRGSRSNATDYYVDGVRVSATSIPDSEIEQLQVVTGGIEARYGDVTGGIISITTKGFSNEFTINAEAETSEGLDNYGNSLVGAAFSGPLLRNADNKAILGFRLSGRYTYREDDDPSAVPLYRVRDDVRAELEANPIRVENGRPFVAADFLTNDDVEVLETRPFESSDRLNLNGKITALLSDNIDVQFTGAYGTGSNQFTPSENAGTGSWRLLNAQRNPTQDSDNLRLNMRFRHRLGGDRRADGDNASSTSIIQNASYDLQLTYENTSSELADPIHGDNFGAYGHVGRFDVDYIPVFELGVDTLGSLFATQVDYREVLRGYDNSTSSNPTQSNYNNWQGLSSDGEIINDARFAFLNQGAETTTLEQFTAINGRTQNLYANSWGFHRNVGAVYNLYQIGDNDTYTFQANAQFQIIPGGKSDKSRHSISLGVWYEQRTNRSYTLAPAGLWTVGRQLANQRIPSVDPTNRVIDSIALDLPNGDMINAALLAPTVVDQDGQFYTAIRERLGVGLDEFVNVDALDPSQLTLDLFSARELTFNGLLDYAGYDYLGNEFNGSFDDFFTLDPNTGERAFNVAPNRPIYAAAYLQDKFTINDMIFRVGVRLDRYDANTRVLKDPYSLYEVIGAEDFHANFGGERPGSIGSDFAVYTTENDGTTVQAYRDGDFWFLPDGTPTNGPQEIDGIRTGLVFPKYANSAVHDFANFIKEDEFTVETSFQDYEVQFNVMPRLAFSFPISDKANFFAHYDVLVQRPPSNTLATALDYFFFVERASRSTFNNPALRPERTVDYEVGFKTLLNDRSALTIAAYYKELRDMIQLRTYFPVPLVNQYTTYDNQDFGTTKGFSLTYDLRRIQNFTVNANYTLQFADGTGSNANSQRGLTNRGNIRTLFPLNFDERHRVNLVLDYRLGSDIQGPKIFENFGINLQATAVSGRPYTANQIPSELGGSGTIGAINGARKPFNFTLNGQVSKDITMKNGSRLNIYARVSNILDRRNELNVYSVTGSATDPGYLQSTFGQDNIRQIEQGTRPLDSYLASYQWTVLNPDFFTLPRRIFVGAVFSL